VGVALLADTSVKTTGTVREVSPTVDAASGAVRPCPGRRLQGGRPRHNVFMRPAYRFR
jgi:hypothetical protein